MSNPLERLQQNAREYASQHTDTKTAETDELHSLALAGSKVASNMFSPIWENAKYLTTGSGGIIDSAGDALRSAGTFVDNYANPFTVGKRLHSGWANPQVSDHSVRLAEGGHGIRGLASSIGDTWNNTIGTYMNPSAVDGTKANIRKVRRYVGATPDPTKSRITGGRIDNPYENWLSGRGTNPYSMNLAGQ